jgi:hypothetical protein
MTAAIRLLNRLLVARFLILVAFCIYVFLKDLLSSCKALRTSAVLCFNAAVFGGLLKGFCEIGDTLKALSQFEWPLPGLVPSAKCK